MNTIPSVFNFNSAAVRTVVIDNEPWFSAADVCAVLGMKNHREATRHLDDDEKGVISNDTPGGAQQISIINESGLYSLVLRSRKPEAKPFIKWVTKEVLPAIRKTGQYIAQPYVQNPGDKLTKEQADTLRNLLTGAVQKLPKEKQAGAMIQGWSKLKAHFKVGYRDIPQSEFTEAISLIARHVIEGEYLPANNASVNAEISEEMLNALALRELMKPGRRFMVFFGKTDNQPNPIMYAIKEQAAVLTPEEMVKHVGESGAFPANLLPAIITAAAARLQERVSA